MLWAIGKDIEYWRQELSGEKTDQCSGQEVARNPVRSVFRTFPLVNAMHLDFPKSYSLQTHLHILDSLHNK